MNSNVEKIRQKKWLTIRGKIPFGIRKELNMAVKFNLLGHLRKDGLKSEVFFHPDHRDAAVGARDQEALDSIEILKKFYADPSSPA